MSRSAVAERYARAVLELGTETGQLRQLTLEIQSIASVYAASPELRSVLDNPLVDAQKREAILRDVATRLGLGHLALNTVRLLALRKKLRALPDMARRLSSLSDEKAGLVRATVTSAAQLGESFYQRLTSEIERAIGKKVVLERKHDPSLIGGVVTRIGDNTIDGSIKGSLAELARQLVLA